MVKLVIKKKPLMDDETLLSLVTQREEAGLSPRELARKFPNLQLKDCMVMLSKLNQKGFLKHQWSACTGDHAIQESRYWIKEDPR